MPPLLNRFRLNNVVLAFLIFFISLFAFLPDQMKVGHDMASYLAIAQNFVSGQGMVDLQGDLSTHRFGYKLILAASLYLGELFFGDGIRFVFYVQMLFCACTAFLTYLLAARLYNGRVGVFAFMLFVLCPTLSVSLISYGLDGVWPVFLLASLLLFLTKNDVNAKRYSRQLLILAFAAIFAGILIWIKEAIGFNFLIVPLLLFLFGCTNYRWRDIILFYGIVFSTFLLGLFIVEGLSQEFAVGTDTVNEHSSFNSALGFAVGYYADNSFLSVLLFLLDGIRGYFLFSNFSQNIHLFYPVFFLFYFSFIWGCVRIAKNKCISDKVLLICLISFVPYMAWAAQWHMRHVQLVFMLSIFSIYIAVFLDSLLLVFSQYSLKTSKWRGFVYRGLLIFALFFVFVFQFSSSKYTAFYLDDNAIVNKASVILGKKDVEADFDGSQLARLITKNVDAGIKVQFFTESIPLASGTVFHSVENLRANVSIYQRIMLGVHENPYIRYLSADNHKDVAFLCMRSSPKPKTVRKKRYIEIFTFVPEIFTRDVLMFDGSSYLLLKAGSDCFDHLQQWIDNEATLSGVKFTFVNSTDQGRLYKVASNGSGNETVNDKADRRIKYSKGFKEYMLGLDSFALSYYKKEFPALMSGLSF